MCMWHIETFESLSYLQDDLQVFHVFLLGLHQLVDVALSLPLLGAHGLQAGQVRTPWTQPESKGEGGETPKHMDIKGQLSAAS